MPSHAIVVSVADIAAEVMIAMKKTCFMVVGALFFSSPMAFAACSGPLTPNYCDSTKQSYYKVMCTEDGVSRVRIKNCFDEFVPPGDPIARRFLNAMEKAREEKERSFLQKKKELEKFQYDKCLVEYGANDFFCSKIMGRSEFYLSCMLDKGLDRNYDVIVAAANVCNHIERTPSTMEKLKYGSGVLQIIKQN